MYSNMPAVIFKMQRGSVMVWGWFSDSGVGGFVKIDGIMSTGKNHQCGLPQIFCTVHSYSNSHLRLAPPAGQSPMLKCPASVSTTYFPFYDGQTSLDNSTI